VTQGKELLVVALALNGRLFIKKELILIWASRFLFEVLPAPSSLSTGNAYISGLAEADGSTAIKNSSLQPDFSVGQKTRAVLDLILSAFICGHVYVDRS